MRDAMMKSLFDLAIADRNVMLLTADLGYGVFEDFAENFPKQFLNVGVAEQNMIGIASGLALEGKIVYVYSIANFPTLRCLEQIRSDACYHELNINIIASGGGFSYGGLGMSHHATEDISIMRSLPGVTVVVPANSWEAGEAVKKLANESGVGYLRIDKSKVENEFVYDEFILGKANILKHGNDFTIIASGGIADEAMKAANILEQNDINCRVISLHTIKPIDSKCIIDAASSTKGILTIEENNKVAGMGSAVAEVCMDFGCIPKKFIRMGMNDEYSSVVGSQQYLRKHYKLDSNSIIEAILGTQK